MVMRYAMDRWGNDYPGGEQALVRRLTQAPHRGYSSLEDVSSWRIEQVLADFYIGLWMDGRPLSSGGTFDSYAFTSWNLFDVIHGLRNVQFRPRIGISSKLHFRYGWNVRAGSSFYLRWTPGGPRGPTSLRVKLPNGAPVPGHMSVWALRIR